MMPFMLPAAIIRQEPADFVVEEIPAYAPSGQGEHAILTFRKTDLTTLEAVRRLARALGADPRAVGFAGMKDRRAVTVQAASFPFPRARDLARAVAGIDLPGIEILDAARNEHKLKPGHLRGNRFTITLRGLDPEAMASIARGLDDLGRRGLPNRFGPQRFGRDGDNPERALAWLGRGARPPGRRAEQRLLFSAVQSLLFNRVLERREQAGTWAKVLPGDLAKKHDTGGLFLVPAQGPELDEARQRAESGGICPTGPMFGPKMTWPQGEVAELERQVLGELIGPPERLEPFAALGPGTRRPLVLRLSELRPHLQTEHGDLTLGFVLPKGGYATTVLSQVCRPIDAQGQSSPSDEPIDPTD
jgi:tRNA pseudouridine13 synthase